MINKIRKNYREIISGIYPGLIFTLMIITLILFTINFKYGVMIEAIAVIVSIIIVKIIKKDDKDQKIVFKLTEMLAIVIFISFLFIAPFIMAKFITNKAFNEHHDRCEHCVHINSDKE